MNLCVCGQEMRFSDAQLIRHITFCWLKLCMMNGFRPPKKDKEVKKTKEIFNCQTVACEKGAVGVAGAHNLS